MLFVMLFLSVSPSMEMYLWLWTCSQACGDGRLCQGDTKSSLKRPHLVALFPFTSPQLLYLCLFYQHPEDGFISEAGFTLIMLISGNEAENKQARLIVYKNCLKKYSKVQISSMLFPWSRVISKLNHNQNPNSDLQ